jgi:DNA-binding CsgD family transcriptional regulator
MDRSGPAARPFFERYYFEDYLPAQKQMVEDRHLAGVLVDPTRRKDYMEPAGYGAELMMTCAADGDMWGTAHFMRVRGADGFTAAETRLARRIAAMLGPALRREPARLPIEGLPVDDIGVLVARLDGRIVRRTPAAKRLLEELGASTSRPEELAHLPLGMLFLVGSVVRGSAAALNVRIRAANSGRWLTVEAETVEGATRETPEIMIVIRPSPPRDLVDLNAAAFGLTPREREIVRLVVIGTSTKEIARALHLSEYTIQEHLQNVFDKTGTANRRSLVARFLFAERVTRGSREASASSRGGGASRAPSLRSDGSFLV